MRWKETNGRSPELAITGPANLGDVVHFRLAAGNCHLQVIRYDDSDSCLGLLERSFGPLLSCSLVFCVSTLYGVASSGRSCRRRCSFLRLALSRLVFLGVGHLLLLVEIRGKL
jgi:hypothetical protein